MFRRPFLSPKQANFTCVYLLAASAIFFAILVAPTVKPDMPIKEAAANLINVFILTLFCVFKGMLCIFYLSASAILWAILVAPTVRPDIPIKEAAANLIKVFIVCLTFLFVGRKTA